VTRHRPDIAVLTEYRVGAGEQIAERLKAEGLVHQGSSNPPAGQNGVFIASRLPFKLSRNGHDPVPSPQHWLEVEFKDFDLGAIYNRAPDEVDRLFGRWLGDLVVQRRRESFLLAGDMNWLEVGDGGNETPGWVEWLRDLGDVDAWRYLNPSGREYSWTNPSHHATRTRIDYVFLSPCVAPRLSNAVYVHDEQTPGSRTTTRSSWT
jgi:exonuclease III